MRFSHLLILSGFLSLTLHVHAQSPLKEWHHLDYTTDQTPGISKAKADSFLRGKKSNPVVVAVIDGGVDWDHVALKSKIWINKKEIAGNKKDDDRDGFVDDTRGWNFLGSANGSNVNYAPYEETREYARLKPLYENADTLKAGFNKKQYAYYKKVKDIYDTRYAKEGEMNGRYHKLYDQAQLDMTKMKADSNVHKIDSTFLKKFNTSDGGLMTRVGIYRSILKRRNENDLDSSLSQLKEYLPIMQARVDYNLNLNYKSPVDDHAQLAEKGYGNNLKGPDPLHATHVSGIITADITSQREITGIAGNVQIMSVRAIPNGDERDKDVANAIIYAVDHGAKVLNMSFGKQLSPQKFYVDKAMRYAASKGVLLVKAAGNDSQNIDSLPEFPSGRYLDGSLITNMITVGASSKDNTENLDAPFSNYGKSVDVFAPGVNIYSSLPDNKYGLESGTSMACPVVAGIAAVLLEYYPKLTAVQVKKIIELSVVKYDTMVYKPGTQEKVPFSSLSKTGGIVNLYNAVKLAKGYH